jgi:hypothetical protein
MKLARSVGGKRCSRTSHRLFPLGLRTWRTRSLTFRRPPSVYSRRRVPSVHRRRRTHALVPVQVLAQYRPFFPLHTQVKVLGFAWVNGEDSKRPPSAETPTACSADARQLPPAGQLAAETYAESERLGRLRRRTRKSLIPRPADAMRFAASDWVGRSNARTGPLPIPTTSSQTGRNGVVAKGGIEPPTRGFSIRCSTN